MQTALKNILLKLSDADKIHAIEPLQDLWSNYGQLLRIHLSNGSIDSLIIKQIQLTKADAELNKHPKGWGSTLSHQRKLQSYQVESQWYKNYAQYCTNDCPVPTCLHVENSSNDILIILSDLHQQGFPVHKTYAQQTLAKHEINSVLFWLAHFHACFMQSEHEGLWPIGSYWHLGTRPEELAALTDTKLKQAAAQLDESLNNCPYQSLIHGDAKLANFCFSEDGQQAAAVDFQYVGQGCGMKDVAYFIGSCVSNEDCFALEKPLLDYYFEILKAALQQYQPQLDAEAVEQCWRKYYVLAWADFQRFIKGWSPQHWKIGSYSEAVTERALKQLNA